MESLSGQQRDVMPQVLVSFQLLGRDYKLLCRLNVTVFNRVLLVVFKGTMSQGRKLPALDSDSESGVVSLLQAGVSPE